MPNSTTKSLSRFYSNMQSSRSVRVSTAAFFGVKYEWTPRMDREAFVCKQQMLSLANLSRNKEFGGRSMAQLPERGAREPLRIKGAESKGDLSLMRLSGWVHPNHLLILCRAVRIQIPWSKSLIGQNEFICLSSKRTNQTPKRERNKISSHMFVLPLCSLKKIIDI